MGVDFSEFKGRTGGRVVAGYGLSWSACVAYLALRGADWTFPLVAMGLFGIVLSLVAWWLTRGSNPPPVMVADPRRQSLWLLAYIALYAFVVIGWGLGALKQVVPPGPLQEWAVLAYKLVFHVAVPAALIWRLGGSLADTFDPGLSRKRVGLTLAVFAAISFGLLAVVSPSLHEIAQTGVSRPAMFGWIGASWLWMSLEAGLCEEYLFRAGLQSRLTAWLQSPLAAILVTCVLFSLVHWPGLYLRGGPDVDGWSTDPLQVAAFTVATLSPLAILLGVLWTRTRSLLLVVAVHGAIDALPHTAEMIRLFG